MSCTPSADAIYITQTCRRGKWNAPITAYILLRELYPASPAQAQRDVCCCFETVGKIKSHCVPGISVQVFHLRAQQLAGPHDTVAVLTSRVTFRLQCDACSVEVDTLMLQVQH